MKKLSKRIASAAAAVSVAVGAFNFPAVVNEKQINANAASNMVLEYLDRGISAINTGKGMLVSWRYLANDDDNATYKLYRDGELIYTSESGNATCYLDKGGNGSSKYRVDTYSGTTLKGSETCRMISNQSYFDLPVTPPTGNGCTYSPNDMSVGDVDGDGQYELFLKWDPSNSQDNSKTGVTGNVFIDCIRLDGTRLWRIDLGVNIRAGAHYTQFFVGDFDLDGKAEMTCKTADGTKDGTGKVIGDGSKVWRDENGLILTGPEYYTLFDGETGAALDTINYVPGRGTATGNDAKKTWGDNYGNRCERYWGMVAYLDGVHPCVVAGRGYYTRMTATAYTVKDKKLVQMWAFDTGFNTSAQGYGDGNHNSMPADVDGDGKQEIITGATCIDDNGKVLWCINTGHGDAMHLGDLIPERPGQELWICHEDKESGWGVTLVDAKNGQRIFHIDGDKDTGRCAADNVWAGNPGAEFWGARPAGKVMNASGEYINMSTPAMNFLTYWDGDLERELLDGGDNSPAVISTINASGKIDTLLTTEGCVTNNSTKANPCLSADIFGDWREELIVRASDNKSVRIYCTPYETDYRITTLMHDAQYRMQVSAQNTAYNQPPHPSFFLGTGYDLPKRPTDTVNTNAAVTPAKPGASFNTSYMYTIKNKKSGMYLEVADAAAENGTNVQQGTDGAKLWKLAESTGGYYYLYSEVGGGDKYLLDLDYGKPDNGTNIGIWENTNSDAQLFKFVDNGDGTYTICTKATKDGSCLGVNGGSTSMGANVLQWECVDSEDQSWIVERYIEPINGRLVTNLKVNDDENRADWKIAENTQVGSAIFGDRDFTYTQLPFYVAGSEAILTACDSKTYQSGLGTFTVSKDCDVYVLVDTRVESSMGAVPSWLNGWTKTIEQAQSSNDVVFDVYLKSYRAGEEVYLGENSTSYNVVNYAVLVMPMEPEPTEPAPTEPPTAEPTTEPTSAPDPVVSGMLGDANCDGEVTIADATAILQSVGNPDKYKLTEQGKDNADVYKRGDGVSGMDALTIQKYDAGLITSFPESFLN